MELNSASEAGPVMRQSRCDAAAQFSVFCAFLRTRQRSDSVIFSNSFPQFAFLLKWRFDLLGARYIRWKTSRRWPARLPARVWNILQCSDTVGVKCSPLLPILTGQGASAQTRLLLHSVTVTLQVNKTDGNAQVFLEGANAFVKDGLLGMGKTKLSKHKRVSIDAQPR